MDMKIVKKELMEMIEHNFYEKVCQEATKDILMFQECAKEPGNAKKPKDLYESCLYFTNYKYGILERKEKKAGSEEGVLLAQLVKSILATACADREIMQIKKFEPVCFEPEHKFGWTAIYY